MKGRDVLKFEKETKRKINVHLSNGQRVRQYVYLTKDDKLWLKQKAKEEGVSVSKLIYDLVKEAIEEDLRLDLEFDN